MNLSNLLQNVAAAIRAAGTAAALRTPGVTRAAGLIAALRTPGVTRTAGIAAALLLMLLTPLAPAVAAGIEEDFTTIALRDSAATTADWNTDTGSLSLPRFEASLVGQALPGGGGVALDIAVREGMA